jgi:competence protein ComEC
MRAGIMAILVLLATWTDRKYNIMRALFAAGALMVAFNPMILAFDPSFQLSFLATLSLIIFAPIIEKRLNWMNSRPKLKEITTATISTQLFVLPLLLYMTGEFSLVALPVNLLVLLSIPTTMLLGFLAGLFAFVHYLIALPMAWAAYFLLEYQLKVVEIFSSIPLATLNIGAVPFWGVLVGYACLGTILLKIYSKKLIPQIFSDSIDKS